MTGLAAVKGSSSIAPCLQSSSSARDATSTPQSSKRARSDIA